jgi:hypothetical protein
VGRETQEASLCLSVCVQSVNLLNKAEGTEVGEAAVGTSAVTRAPSGNITFISKFYKNLTCDSGVKNADGRRGTVSSIFVLCVHIAETTCNTSLDKLLCL